MQKQEQSQTVAEKPETILAQLAWLAAGKRRAVLIPNGTPAVQVPEGMVGMETPAGVVIYDPARLTAEEILRAVQADRLGELLGYGVASKPLGAVTTVVIRDAKGLEKQAVVADVAQIDSAVAAANAVKDPGDEVRLERPEYVVAQRLRDGAKRSPIEGLPEVRPIRDQAELARVVRAAAADGHVIQAPTHVVEREGKVIGYVALQSVPVFLLWMDSKEAGPRDSVAVLNVVENTVRMGGGARVGTLIDPESPFFAVAERLGYKRAEAVAHFKQL